MDSNFKICVFTSPEHVEEEAVKLTALLDLGVDYIHLRKPAWSYREVKDLIENIPYKYRKKLRLHGHFELLNEMNLAGVQLNSRNPLAPINGRSVTASMHSLEELEKSDDYEYVTLSPIFDSISKNDYKSKFDIENLGAQLAGHKVIALGGIRPEHFSKLKEKGFFGAALLGYIWNNDFEEACKKLKYSISQL